MVKTARNLNDDDIKRTVPRKDVFGFVTLGMPRAKTKLPLTVTTPGEDLGKLFKIFVFRPRVWSWHHPPLRLLHQLPLFVDGMPPRTCNLPIVFSTGSKRLVAS